ncbi:CBS domain-containing protein [Pseudobacteriovorax antillogorgiicola]|uniref:CBS domain-containing protein n=1 Tax=Pseudobacteriovorax antillogorgiicola TaxID=1513793 RepID=A0A1Y6BKI9_9BACT|nr:CBS domain-containing protein [Pseudobacteriovorax antillogorgiicola]TCS56226.1 CBS domain protein [Pseudobacteriovorax antillogorgiicola]SMF08307.1 CBS domain-containing protein [Pseudobacteriovorax antillogorgiicola]
MLTSKEIMTKNITYINPDLDVEKAGEYLIQKGLSSVPVVVDQGPRLKLVGFLSEADLLNFCSNQVYFDQPNMTVKDLMRNHPYCVGEDVEIFELARIFMDTKYRLLPVLDAQGYLVGVVRRRVVLDKILKLIKAEDSHLLNRVQKKDLHQLVNHRFIVG